MSTITIPRLIRNLPGIPWKNGLDRITYLKGVIVYSSARVEYAETDSKIYRLVPLIGETFIYVCEKRSALHPAQGPCTVYEQEVEAMRQHEIDAGKMPGPRRCPFCSGPIHRVERGDKVRLHYRFAADGRSAAWWGERWEW